MQPGQTAAIPAKLFVGPKIQEQLEALAPNLDRTVDYGWLTVLAKPLFWLLDQIHNLVKNWGWSIIILTILIKLAFYKLSAASYKSMAHMRQVQPKMASIKDSANVVVHFTPATGECLAFVDDGAGGGTPDDRVRNGSERIVRQFKLPVGITLASPSFGSDLEFSNRGLPTAGGDISIAGSGRTKTIRVLPSGHTKIM